MSILGNLLNKTYHVGRTSSHLGKPSHYEAGNVRRVGHGLPFSTAEAYKMLRTNLFMSFSEQGGKVIGITSSDPNEGKTMTALNLAVSIVDAGKKVCFVEADLRLPAATRQVGGNPLGVGLTEVITGDVRSEISSGIDRVVVRKYFEGVDMVFSGRIPPNPAELLGSDRMKRIISDLQKAYDYVIVDLPPINEVSDPIVVSPLLSGVILVVRHEVANQIGLKEAFRRLELAEVKVLGYVYNGSTNSVMGYKKYKKYKKYSKYKKK